MIKKIIISTMLVSVMLCGCAAPEKVKEIKAVNVWWGTKEEVKTFLDTPEAKAQRWLIQSLGESDK